MPDGTRLDFTYASGTSGILKSVFSNRGWAILFESQYRICAVNLAETFVTPTSACPANVQAVTYSYSPGTYVTSWNLMRSATRGNATREYLYASNDHVSCIKDPGQSNCRIQNTYARCLEDPQIPFVQPNIRLRDPVISQQDGSGRTYTYSYSADTCPQWPWITDPDYRSISPVTTTMTATGVPGNTIVQTDLASQPYSITDPLGDVTQISYETSVNYDGSFDYYYESGDPTEVVSPEGNKENYVRDSRGNIISQIMTAKPGSGLPNIVTNAAYPASCNNPVTCNKPTSVTNARGNITEFSYDPTHGGVMTETLPADANGIRAVKRYAYVQRAAWLKTGGGSYAPSPRPVWLVSEIRTCRTTATVAGGCAGGASDEIVTTYDYGPNAGPNNLLMRGMVVIAGATSLRTCYGYDRDGRRISETQPNANLTSCP